MAGDGGRRREKVGECLSGTETAASWGGQGLSKDSGKLGWKGRWRLPGTVIPLGREEAPQNGRWWQTKDSITVWPCVVLFASSRWINFGSTTTAPVFVTCLRITAMMTVNTTIMTRCWVAFQFWLKSEPRPIPGTSTTFTFGPILLGLLCGLDGISCWGMNWPHSLHSVDWFRLGLVGYGFIPCDWGWAKLGLG